jgi:hypothetical protein
MILQTEFFNVSPTTVYGLLLGGMAIVIGYLAVENKYLKKQIISLAQNTIEKLTEIKGANSAISDKIDNMIKWIRKYNNP